jgi:hypothetical protein
MRPFALCSFLIIENEFISLQHHFHTLLKILATTMKFIVDETYGIYIYDMEQLYLTPFACSYSGHVIHNHLTLCQEHVKHHDVSQRLCLLIQLKYQCFLESHTWYNHMQLWGSVRKQRENLVQAYTYLQASENLDYGLVGTVNRPSVIPRQIASVQAYPDLYGECKYVWKSLQMHCGSPGSPQNFSEVSENRKRTELAFHTEIRYKSTLLYKPGRYPNQNLCRIVAEPT